MIRIAEASHDALVAAATRAAGVGQIECDGRDAWIGPSVTLTRDVAPGSVYRPPRSERRDVSSYELLGVEE